MRLILVVLFLTISPLLFKTVAPSQVATLVNEEMKPGNYERIFDGSGLASGVYVYHLRIGERVETKKPVLVR
jgi:hypothetical protein